MVYEHYAITSWLFPFEHFSHGHFVVGTLSLALWIIVVYAMFIYISRFYSASKRVHRQSHKHSASIVAVFISFLLFSSVAYAMCPVGFSPPGRVYQPEDNTHGLLVFESGQEKLILEPSFRGNATDFGLVLPLPSRPELREAPEKLFVELEDVTNPIRSFGGGFGRGSFSPETVSSDGVRVVEKKDVGDFKTTVLTADSTSALIQWLKENNYQYHPSDEQNFEYYVRTGGYYFVAMKVNMEKANLDASGFLKGKLRPIEFSFSTDRPMLPLRSMAGDMEQMTFTLYVLSGEPYYIPGVDILYSKKVSFKDMGTAPSLLEYNAWGRWLVRNEARFDPKLIGQDLFLERGNHNFVVESVRSAKRINPHLLAANSGIVEGERGSLVYLDNPTQLPEDDGGFPLRAAMRLAGGLVVLGAGLLVFRSWKKRGLVSKEGQAFMDTRQAVEHDTSISFLKLRNALGGLISGAAVVSFTYLGLVSGSWLQRSVLRVDEAIRVLLLIAVGLVYVLFIFGPAIYLAAKHGWRSFISVIVAELLSILLFISLVILQSIFPFWSLVPYLF